MLKGRNYPLAGDAFEAGLALGKAFESGFFMETSYRLRQLPSVEWKLPTGVTALPAGWPRSLDLSGWFVGVGWQFQRKPASPAPKTP